MGRRFTGGKDGDIAVLASEGLLSSQGTKGLSVTTLGRRQRPRKCPLWMRSETEIIKFFRKEFPQAFSTELKDRKRFRTLSSLKKKRERLRLYVAVIQVYFRMGVTAAETADEINNQSRYIKETPQGEFIGTNTAKVTTKMVENAVRNIRERQTRYKLTIS